jgi:regulator of replication initiation timing
VLSTPAAPSCPPSCPPTPPTDTVPREQYDKLAEDFSNLAKEFSTMKQQFSSLIEAEHSRAIELKLNKLNALNLPESTKQTFSDMIKSGTLTAAAEEKLFSDYQQLSENYKHVFAQPQGSSDEGRKGSTEVELPEFYSQIIERNNKIIEARGGNPSFQLL